MTDTPVNRVWRIARPMGPVPGPEDFALSQEPLPEPGPGQVLMRTIFIGIAPGVRPLLPYAGAEPGVANDGSAGRVDASADDLPNPMRIRVGERMRSGIVPSASIYAGGTVGQVVVSHHSGFAPGDYIFGGRLWQDYEVVDGEASLTLGRPSLLFLRPLPASESPGGFDVAGRAQGQYAIRLDEKQKPRLVQSASAGGVVAPRPGAATPLATDVLHQRPLGDAARDITAAWGRLHAH